MKRVKDILAVITLCALAGCSELETEFGNVRIYFPKDKVFTSVKSTWFEDVPDENEPKDTVVNQIGVVLSGIRNEMPQVDFTVETDIEYARNMIASVGNPTVEQTDEVVWYKWKEILPEDCYTLNLENLFIENGKREAVVPLTLHKEKLAELDPELEYILPLKLTSASVDINKEFGRSMFVVKVEKDLAPAYNIAVGKPVTASASASNMKPENVVDGINNKDNSRWFPEATLTGDHWLEIDLGGKTSVCGLRLWTGWGGTFTDPLAHFSFQIWNDILQDWENVITETSNGNPTYEKLFHSVKTSKVRLYIYKDSKVRLYEVEVLSRSSNLVN